MFFPALHRRIGTPESSELESGIIFGVFERWVVGTSAIWLAANMAASLGKVGLLQIKQGQIGLKRSESLSLIPIHSPRGSRGGPTVSSDDSLKAQDQVNNANSQLSF